MICFNPDGMWTSLSNTRYASLLRSLSHRCAGAARQAGGAPAGWHVSQNPSAPSGAAMVDEGDMAHMFDTFVSDTNMFPGLDE